MVASRAPPPSCISSAAGSEIELSNPTDEFPEGSEAYTIFTHYASLYDDEDFSMILDAADSLSEMTNDQGRIETQVLHNAVTLRDGWID